MHFVGTIVDAQGSVTRYTDDGDRRVKRRKFDVGAGKKAIRSLLGDYGSDDEDEEARSEDGVMTKLGEYGESDEAEDGGETEAQDLDEDEKANINLNPAALLELVQQAQALDSQAGDEDLVDWGDSDEGESV